jgi:hypothetical protein
MSYRRHKHEFWRHLRNTSKQNLITGYEVTEMSYGITSCFCGNSSEHIGSITGMAEYTVCLGTTLYWVVRILIKPEMQDVLSFVQSK